MHLSKGDMPLTRNPDRMSAGVMVLGNVVSNDSRNVVDCHRMPRMPDYPPIAGRVVILLKRSVNGTIERLQLVRCVRRE